MNKYGKKIVLEADTFQEGLVVELVNGEIICREYYKNEYEEKQVEGDGIKIDFVAVAEKKTPISQMREIARQIGNSNFAIDKSVVSFIAKLREN